MDEAKEYPDYVVRKGTRIIQQEGHTVLVRGNEKFAPENRSLEDLEIYYRQTISHIIEGLLERHTDRPVTILDIGGGVNSTAVKDLQSKYGDRIRAVNVDIAHHKTEGAGAARILSDVRQLPVADGSIDLVFSHQLFPYLDRKSIAHDSSVEQGLSEIARILAPGGYGIINDNEEISGLKSGTKMNQLAQRLGVELESKESRRAKSFRRWPNIHRNNYRAERYLMMKKTEQQTVEAPNI